MDILNTKIKSILTEKNTKIIPSNIKKDVNILGITGTYEGQKPSGEIEITENGQVDVSQYASANVNVSSGGDASEYFKATIGGGSGSGNNAIPGFALALKKVPPGLVAGDYASYMFNRCTSLEEVTNLDTSNTTNMSYMFRNCSKLHKIANLNTSKCTNFMYMFQGCSALETIPLIDTSKGTSVTQMFYQSGITTIPLLDFSSATSLLSMFQYCTKLESVPLLNISHIRTLMSAFSGCTKLAELPAFDTSSVIDMSSMCYNCKVLTTVPQFITANVITMQSVFASCPNLTNESLNNILGMCTNVSESYRNTKTLKDVGLTQEQAETCQTLSNWDDFVAAGWTSGY